MHRNLNGCKGAWSFHKVLRPRLTGLPKHKKICFETLLRELQCFKLCCNTQYRQQVELIRSPTITNLLRRMTDITPFQQIVSSCSGALATSFLITPFDVVKIRLQSQVTLNQKGSTHPCQLNSKVSTTPKNCFLYCNGLMDHLCVCATNKNNGSIKWYNRPSPVYLHGTMDAFYKISKLEGVSSLWSGLSPTLVMAVPATVIYYTSYDQLKYAFIRRFGDRDTIPMMAGGIARIGTVSIISPLELVRTKMQSKPVTYREICNVVRSSIATNGIGSLWLGWWPMILRDVPFSMLCWTFIEMVKKKSNFESVFVTSFISGSIAGCVSAIVTQPFDVIKTKWQITLGENIRKAQPTYNSALSSMNAILQTSGYRGLFAGLLPRMMKITPACAIMLSSYDVGKSFFYKRNVLKRLQDEQQSTILTQNPNQSNNQLNFLNEPPKK